MGSFGIVDPEESELETLRAALEILPTGLVILDAEGRIVRASRVVEQRFLYWLDELVGAPIEMLVPELGPEALARDEADEPGGGRPRSMAGVAGRRRDGSELSLDVTLLATRADDAPATIVVLEDADDARSRHRIAILEAFVEASDDAVFSQGQDGEITSWNLSAERIFGHPASEIVGLPATALFPEHLRADAELVFASAIDGNRMNHVEIEMERKDGMPFPASLSLSLVRDPSGLPVSCVVLARDVTEQRLAQATLAETEARVRESERLSHVGSWGWDLRTGAVQWTDELHRIHDVDPFEFAGTIDAYLAAIHTGDRVACARRDDERGDLAAVVRDRVPSHHLGWERAPGLRAGRAHDRLRRCGHRPPGDRPGRQQSTAADEKLGRAREPDIREAVAALYPGRPRRLGLLRRRSAKAKASEPTWGAAAALPTAEPEGKPPSPRPTDLDRTLVVPDEAHDALDEIARRGVVSLAIVDHAGDGSERVARVRAEDRHEIPELLRLADRVE